MISFVMFDDLFIEDYTFVTFGSFFLYFLISILLVSLPNC